MAGDKNKFVVLTISDSCYKKEAQDKSGPRLMRLVTDTFGDVQIIKDIVPDEQEVIQDKLKLHSRSARAIFTTGGTGFSPRDVTPEATKAVITKECPQLVIAMTLESLKVTPLAALSRAVAGILHNCLIINFPGSEKAVTECFISIRSALPHALQLINDHITQVKLTHDSIQGASNKNAGHECPHATGANSDSDRHSQYPMISVEDALRIVIGHPTFKDHRSTYSTVLNCRAPVDIPPFRASIKDGYAMKSTGFSGIKKVAGHVAAGDTMSDYEYEEDECVKINTGAPIPLHCDCVVQVEDTKVLRRKKNGVEDLVEILVEPRLNKDIRPVGSDMKKGDLLFPYPDFSDIVVNSITASVGSILDLRKPKVGIISTGSELMDPAEEPSLGKIYDSNTTMLKKLLQYFGFDVQKVCQANDDYRSLCTVVENMHEQVDVIICTGGVSMGDRDYVKDALKNLRYDILFGRVNMKPGKPMTFAVHEENQKQFFGLPGNPVSAFVTFHLFVLPALRWSLGWDKDKCILATIEVTLENEYLDLDPRPEYARASVKSKNGRLFASVNGDQISSRLQSIVDAGVLLHLPPKTSDKTRVTAGTILKASVLRYDFISSYE